MVDAAFEAALNGKALAEVYQPEKKKESKSLGGRFEKIDPVDAPVVIATETEIARMLKSQQALLIELSNDSKRRENDLHAALETVNAELVVARARLAELNGKFDRETAKLDGEDEWVRAKFNTLDVNTASLSWAGFLCACAIIAMVVIAGPAVTPRLDKIDAAHVMIKSIYEKAASAPPVIDGPRLVSLENAVTKAAQSANDRFAAIEAAVTKSTIVERCPLPAAQQPTVAAKAAMATLDAEVVSKYAAAIEQALAGMKTDSAKNTEVTSIAYKDGVLKTGQILTSTTSSHVGVMQSDCNFVVYKNHDMSTSNALWSTRTNIGVSSCELRSVTGTIGVVGQHRIYWEKSCRTNWGVPPPAGSAKWILDNYGSLVVVDSTSKAALCTVN